MSTPGNGDEVVVQCTTWQAWAPPLDPPTPGGLDMDTAQCIADATWAEDPHLCAALQWESYAATLPPTPSVWSVSTGAQSVEQRPAAPLGEYGLAMQRAQWHRSFTSTVVGVPMVVAPSRFRDHSGRVWLPSWWATEEGEVAP